ncbi:MAG: hypothetical protein D4S01_00680 [Dehalococcoidia bacterium]|nr:MAG: hypothetical protein D4S01_00680 [Dehalococcoidia bacterium]
MYIRGIKITYIGGNNTNRMLSFVFNCEFVGGMALQDLVRIKNCRLLELYDKNFVDINQLFDGDPEVRTTFEEFEQRFAD